MKLKIQPNEILNDALAVVTAAGILGAIFVVANKFFGLMSYNGQSSAHLADVIKKLTTEYSVISSVSGRSIWGRDYQRGLLMSKSGLIYYYRFEYENGAPVQISIYPEVFETFRTEPALFDSATLL